MEVIAKIVLAVLPSLVTGIILAVWNSKQNRRVKDQDKKEEKRIELDMLRLNLLVATAQLSQAVAIAIKRGYPNGEIEIGIEKYNEAMEEFREFERKQIAEVNNEK